MSNNPNELSLSAALDSNWPGGQPAAGGMQWPAGGTSQPAAGGMQWPGGGTSQPAAGGTPWPGGGTSQPAAGSSPWPGAPDSGQAVWGGHAPNPAPMPGWGGHAPNPAPMPGWGGPTPTPPPAPMPGWGGPTPAPATMPGWPGPGPGQPTPGPVKVPYNQKFPNGLRKDMLITINGTVKPHAKMFTLDFSTGRDLAFHFNARFNEEGKKVLVRNSEINKKWGKEERTTQTFPFVQGQSFEMKVLVTNQEYKVAVNGSHLLEFRHRLGLGGVTNLSIYNDLSLTSVVVT